MKYRTTPRKGNGTEFVVHDSLADAHRECMISRGNPFVIRRGDGSELSENELMACRMMTVKHLAETTAELG